MLMVNEMSDKTVPTGLYDGESLELLEAQTISEIRKFLASSIFVGIGPTLAKKIVLAFGIQTIEIIETSPAKLEAVRLIGPKRISSIRRGWTALARIKKSCAFLMSLRAPGSPTPLQNGDSRLPLNRNCGAVKT